MFTSTAKKTSVSHLAVAAEPVVGRSFVLGIPDKLGIFHIFVYNQLWSINPGAYKAGDRVCAMAVENDLMLVRKTDLSE